MKFWPLVLALAIAGCGATVIIDPWVRFPPPEAHFTVTIQAAATIPATQPAARDQSFEKVK